MNKKNSDCFYINNPPIKLTEARRLKLHAEGWGFLSEYSLESVKITNFKGRLVSTATLRVVDRSGQVSCLIKGQSVGLLFGLSASEWAEVEGMCIGRDQLFYRYFKNGISKNFAIEQKLFYNFCMTCQRHDALIAKFRRSVNMRNKFKNDVFVEVLLLKKCDINLLDLYIDYLRLNSVEKPQD